MEVIKLNALEEGKSFIPYYKNVICAGRAAEGLREDWRKQLVEIQRDIGYKYIRFHGIFHEDMMVYRINENGEVELNFQYVDNLFDFLQSVGLKPFVELGFMPYDMASGSKTQFWWKGNITPPKDYEAWAKLCSDLVIHLINRYGFKEVNTWYFEVWNEANVNFWTGTFQEYCKLYEYTVKAIKKIDASLKVGGPAAPNHSKDGYQNLIDEFLTYCEERNLPVDFVSPHPYPNMWGFDCPGFKMGYREEDALLVDLNWLRQRLENSIYKNAEI